LLEEPWQGFDEASQKQIIRYIKQDLNEATAIIASNDEQFAKQCDFVVIMENGEIVKQGKPSDVLF
jgi:ABC-type transport system involved in cytochrome bd biosynthesis fused ATPase/permease subunit